MNINLMPEAQAVQVKTRRSNYAATAFAIILVAAVAAVILLLWAIVGTKKKEIADYKNQVSNIKSELQDYKDVEKTVITVEQGTRDINNLKSMAVNWSKVFPHFEKAMPENLQLNDYSFDGKKMRVSGITNGVDTLNKYLQSLNGYEVEGANGEGKIKPFQNVTADGYEVDDKTGRVKFNILLDFQGGSLWN